MRPNPIRVKCADSVYHLMRDDNSFRLESLISRDTPAISRQL